MKVALVLNGDPPDEEDLRLLAAYEKIVCTDGGAETLMRADRPPHLIIGDLDSLAPEVYRWAEALGIPIERFPEDKDAIDGELAIERILEMEPASVLILGGHGGRTGMFLANMRLLRRCHERGLEAAMIGHREGIRFVSEGGELRLAGRKGCALDIMAVEHNARIDLVGTRWDGEDVDLRARSTRGCSNRIIAEIAKITVRHGTIITVVERPKRH